MNILLMLFFNLNILKYDYELIDFSDAALYSEESLLHLVNKTKEDLQSFSCQNSERYLVFTDSEIPNIKNDSLKIKSASGNLLTYKSKKLFLGEKEYRPKENEFFLNQFLKAAKTIENTISGRILISKLSSSSKTFIIKRGWSHFEPNFEHERKMWHINEAGFGQVMDTKKPRFGDKTPLKFIGSGGLIYWEPIEDAKFVEADYVKRTVLPELVLIHEMYHAYDSARGFLDRRLVKGNNLEFSEAIEYRAVYFENIVRAELGRKYRRYYGDPTSFNGPDMLDENDQPIMIPSSCIGWI